MLGLSGVVLVMLSVLGSAGFFSALGVKSTLIIMEVIPFLVLAVSFLKDGCLISLLWNRVHFSLQWYTSLQLLLLHIPVTLQHVFLFHVCNFA